MEEDETDTVAVWAGTFPSRRRFEQFFRETHERGEKEPLSEFAASQGQRFYDHDFVECCFFEEPSVEPRVLLERGSYSASYIDAAERAFAGVGFPANATVLAFRNEIGVPRSVSGEGYALRYLGRFAYDPQADSLATASESAVPTAAVQLELQGRGTLDFEGRAMRKLRVDRRRGLAIGRGGTSAADRRPYLDLASRPEAEAVAPVQVLVYADPFDNWVIEDRGRNGLTRLGSVVLSGERSMPWHGDRLAVGPVTLRWNCFPEPT